MGAKTEQAILVVEDQPDVLEPISIALFMEGYKVRSAESRDAALSAVLEQPPDIILLDLFMPGMGAEEFIAQVRSHSPKTRIVLMTAADKAQAEAQRLGLKTFLAKPFDYQTLMEALLE